jgi:hypothetical protein
MPKLAVSMPNICLLSHTNIGFPSILRPVTISQYIQRVFKLRQRLLRLTQVLVLGRRILGLEGALQGRLSGVNEVFHFGDDSFVHALLKNSVTNLCSKMRLSLWVGTPYGRGIHACGLYRPSCLSRSRKGNNATGGDVL